MTSRKKIKSDRRIANAYGVQRAQAAQRAVRDLEPMIDVMGDQSGSMAWKWEPDEITSAVRQSTRRGSAARRDGVE